MVQNNKYSQLTNTYLSLRKAVGWIGISLPFVLMVGVFVIFGKDIVQQSISHYYYTGMGNVFVGAMCAIALFMFFYCGYDKLDDWAGNIAGLFALGVAWFPTTETGSTTLTGTIHLTCAACLFLTLAVFSIFLFTKKDSNPTPRKLVRNKIYIACGIIMLACIMSIAVYNFILHLDNSSSSFVFWAETVALVAFGISWLTKGGTLYADKEESKE